MVEAEFELAAVLSLSAPGHKVCVMTRLLMSLSQAVSRILAATDLLPETLGPWRHNERAYFSCAPPLERIWATFSTLEKAGQRVFQEAQILPLLLGRGYLPGGVLALHPLLPLSPPLREEQG